MRWAVVRLIAVREVRDQLRDRRTMFLILGLPVLMYPLFIGVALMFASTLQDKKLIVGVVGMEYLPQPGGAAGATKPYPPLLVDGTFPRQYLPKETEPHGTLIVKRLDSADEKLLASRQVDALVVVEPDLATKLERGERPAVKVLGRDGEENSKLAVQGVTGVLRKWVTDLKTTRFARDGKTEHYDSPVEVRDPQTDKPIDKKMADELRDVLVKVIPLLLVMWILTGAIYPAIDMTAGEKERGTMETLLISPAERIEIVFGKFLAVTALGFSTAIWNVLLMVVAVAIGQILLPYPLLSLVGLGVCVVAAMPLAMLFAACCLTLGVFARSTKEGNYYMVPMFFLVLPLAYWSMAPGIELDAKMSWVPITNALLLQQRLMSVRPDPFPWRFVPAVAISMFGCIGLALWATIRQFQRESVLFREAEHSSRRWSLFSKRARS